VQLLRCVLVGLVASACSADDAAGVDALGADAPATPDTAQVTDGAHAHVPILFIHGINGSAADFDAMIARFTARGWPANYLAAHTFEDPAWGCNVDNAATIQTWAAELAASTGATQIDVVAHSMGTLSSRYFEKNLGGTVTTRTYVTLGGMHHGLDSSCSPDFPLKPCVWTEICSTGDYVAQLNADPATPGPSRWISIYGSADTTVPNESSILTGAENIMIDGADHIGLLEQQPTFDVLAPLLDQ
jgi:triacylglycerol lipase